MPNWVYNNLSITDPSGEHGEDVTRLMEQVGAKYTAIWSHYEKTDEGVKVSYEEVEVVDCLFAFWNIKRPEGEDLELYKKSRGESGVSPFWYDWNCKNWGTKWEASDITLETYSDYHKQVMFSTPWSPPLPVLVTLSEQYPNLHIELEWEEEQGFGGTFTFTNGEQTETEYYDIPSTHEELMDRKDYCYCENGEKVFSDCPIEEITPDMLVPEDEILIEQMI